MKLWHVVEHEPKWQPARLRIDAAGNTAPGFVCVHLMENGNGRCGSNVFSIASAFGRHSCVVDGRLSRMRAMYHRRRRRW